MLTTQELFDTVVNHLRAQDISSVSNGQCLYRAPNGLKCAVGCLIKDEHYSESLEDCPVENSTVQEAVNKSIGRDLTCNEFDLLQRLQDFHDGLEWCESYKTNPDFESGLCEIANDSGLEYKEPKQ